MPDVLLTNSTAERNVSLINHKHYIDLTLVYVSTSGSVAHVALLLLKVSSISFKCTFN